jgi:hypothetical protein
MIRKYKGGGCGCGASRSLGFPLTGGQNANVTRFNGNGLFPNSKNGGQKMPMANSFLGGQVETPLVATQTPTATTNPSATSIVNNPELQQNASLTTNSTMVNTSTAPTNGLNTGGIMSSIASAFGMNKPKSNSLVTTGGRRTKRNKKSRKTKKSKKSRK